jgi:alkylation response protein AidB-like acyl-CoA dehydrogenase
MAQGAFDIAHGYAYQRVQFGRPIAQHQAIGHLLADMATDVEMARLLTYRTAWKRDAGLAYTVDAAMAKLAASQIATSVANRGMQILGSYSYSTEYPMERYFRETKLFEIAGGTSQMLRNIIVKRLAVVRSD